MLQNAENIGGIGITLLFFSKDELALRGGIVGRLFTGLSVVAAALAVCAAGCGGGTNEPPRYAVSGKITLKGVPLEGGIIQFAPMDKQKSSGFLEIKKDGTYEIQQAVGLNTGKYKVSIIGGEGTEELAPGEAPGPSKRKSGPGKERVPAEYNTKSDKVVEVTANGPNKFDFTIK